MKISKTAVLALGGVIATAGLGLMAVSAATPQDQDYDKKLFMNLDNAVQHFEKIKFITGTNAGSDSVVYMKKGGSNAPLVEIDANNFVVTQTGINERNVIGGGNGNSILGGIYNKILDGSTNYNVILGGKSNTINGGFLNSVILGGESNTVRGSNSVIVGGVANESHQSAVAVGNNSHANGKYSVAIGNHNEANGGNSVALGSKAIVNGVNSFLWSDGTQGTVGGDNIFAVNAASGMVVGLRKAHSFSKLTIGGSLVVGYNNKELNKQDVNSDYKGVLQIKKVKNLNNLNKYCFCSYDGAQRNSLHGGGKCTGTCDESRQAPVCDEEHAEINCGEGNVYTITNGCLKGQVVEGTGEFLIDKEDKIHWTCEEDNGDTIGCVKGPVVACNVPLVEFKCNVPNKSCDYSAKAKDEFKIQTSPKLSPSGDYYYWTCGYNGSVEECRSNLPTATLTYNANSCGTAPANVTLTYGVATSAASMTSVSGGKTFQKWCTASNGGGSCYTVGQQVKAANTTPSDITLYAICTDPTATLTYNANSCGTAPANVTLKYATAVNAAGMVSVNAGKTFQKWCTTNNGIGGSCYTVGQQVKAANTTPSSVTLYAICTDDTATLTYNANSCGTAPANVTLKYATAVNAAGMVSVNAGKTFQKWCTTNNGIGGSCYTVGQQVKAANTTPSSVTLYAICGNSCYKNWTVTYDKNGGESVSKSSASVYYGNAVDLTPTATRAGYTFTGWNTDRNATEGLSSYTMPCNNVTLYAVYQDDAGSRVPDDTATLTYNANSCGTAPANVTLKYATAVNAAGMVSVNAGKTFQKWCTANNGGGTCYTVGQQVKAANTTPSSITLYAICTDDTATLTYNANSCGTAPANVTLKYATAVNAAGMVSVNEGREFLKWCTASNGGGTCYTVGQQVKAANKAPSNITLYAICQESSYEDEVCPAPTITSIDNLYYASFDLNGANVSAMMTILTKDVNNRPSGGGVGGWTSPKKVASSGYGWVKLRSQCRKSDNTLSWSEDSNIMPYGTLCGSAADEGKTYTSAPTSNLCADGTSSSSVTEGTDKYRWTCTKGDRVDNCEAGRREATDQEVCGSMPAIVKYMGVAPNYIGSVMYNGNKYWLNYDCECNRTSKKWDCSKQEGNFNYGATKNQYGFVSGETDYNSHNTSVTVYASAGNYSDFNNQKDVGTCNTSVYNYFMGLPDNTQIGTTSWTFHDNHGAVACGYQCNTAYGGPCNDKCWMAFNCSQLTSDSTRSTYRCGPSIVITCYAVDA